MPGFDFSDGVPETIAVSFQIPTLPGSPEFTHHMRRDIRGAEWANLLEKITSAGTGTKDKDKREALFLEAFCVAYAQLMDLPECRIEGYGPADELDNAGAVAFIRNGPEGASERTKLELRRHAIYAVNGYIALRNSEGAPGEPFR